MLRPKPRGTNAWLPSQVAYGIDCSDSDPEKWTPFGDVHDKLQEEQAKHAAKASSTAPSSTSAAKP